MSAPGTESSIHVPVMAEEILTWLQPRPGQTLVDGTLGGGGHTRRLAEAVGPTGRVIACDRDPAAVDAARDALPVTPVHANYADLPDVLASLGVARVSGIVLDLGLSSDQLAGDRGFSFESDGPLDLRFDPTEGESAADLLQRLPERELADVIFRFGEERFSRRIARRIVESRRERPVRTAAELAQLVRRCVPRSRGHAIDPATRTFQAFRIRVNGELDSLERALDRLPECLEPGGRLAVLSFHSLEDRLVKTAFRGDPRWSALTKKPIRPNDSETARNPRSRSAKLRVAERR